MGLEETRKKEGTFHGFGSPTEALNHYYEHVLGGRHPDGFEYKQEKALLEWLATRGEE